MKAIEAQQDQLKKMLDYKAASRLCESCGIVSAEENKDMEKAYTQEILLLKEEIAKLMK